MYEKMTAVYFSATGNTKAYVDACLHAVNLPTKRIDVTSVTEFETIEIEENELLLLAAPDYSGRIPDLARQRFQKIIGKGADAVLLVTFGNRAIDDALVEMEDLVKQNGFTVVGGAGFVGKHTFGEIATDRPSENDLQEAQNFMKRVLEKPKGTAVAMPGNRPYKEASKKGKWHPETLNSCVHCGRCQKECPAGAIAADCKTITENCISCFHCISVCPVHAKVMQSKEYLDFAEGLTVRLAKPQKNEIYID